MELLSLELGHQQYPWSHEGRLQLLKCLQICGFASLREINQRNNPTASATDTTGCLPNSCSLLACPLFHNLVGRSLWPCPCENGLKLTTGHLFGRNVYHAISLRETMLWRSKGSDVGWYFLFSPCFPGLREWNLYHSPLLSQLLLKGPRATNSLLWQPGQVAVFLLSDSLQLRFSLVDGMSDPIFQKPINLVAFPSLPISGKRMEMILW